MLSALLLVWETMWRTVAVRQVGVGQAANFEHLFLAFGCVFCLQARRHGDSFDDIDLPALDLSAVPRSASFELDCSDLDGYVRFDDGPDTVIDWPPMSGTGLPDSDDSSPLSSPYQHAFPAPAPPHLPLGPSSFSYDSSSSSSSSSSSESASFGSRLPR